MTTDRPPETDIVLTINLPSGLRQQIATSIVSREMGRWRNAAVPVVPALGAALVSAPTGWLLGLPPGTAIILGLYGFVGAALGFFVLRRWLNARSQRILANSALLNRPTGLVLGDSGLTITATTLAWGTVARTERWKGCTLLYFSDADALVIPDAALSDGSSPEGLVARIAAWRVQ